MLENHPGRRKLRDSRRGRRLTGSEDSGEPPPKHGPSSRSGHPESGVMGALPRSRPSVRSPRRDAASARRARLAAGRRQATADEGAQPGLEDLARAGVSAAAGAATLGLRIAGRAASAVRGALERR
jgi:hypothetical protein